MTGPSDLCYARIYSIRESEKVPRYKGTSIQKYEYTNRRMYELYGLYEIYELVR